MVTFGALAAHFQQMSFSLLICSLFWQKFYSQDYNRVIKNARHLPSFYHCLIFYMINCHINGYHWVKTLNCPNRFIPIRSNLFRASFPYAPTHSSCHFTSVMRRPCRVIWNPADFEALLTSSTWGRIHTKQADNHDGMSIYKYSLRSTNEMANIRKLWV